MCKSPLFLVLVVVFSGCSGISLKSVDNSGKIAVLPSLNFSGYNLSRFPVMIYRDAELTRLFHKVDSKTVNLAKVMQTQLLRRLRQSARSVVLVNEDKNPEKHALRNYNSKYIKSIQEEHGFQHAFFCVFTEISLKNVFKDNEIYLRIQLVNIDKTGKILQKFGKSFVIHVPDRAYTPLGVDISDIINEFAENIIKELT